MSNGGEDGNGGGDESPSFMRLISDRELGSLTSSQKGFIIYIRTLDPSLNGQQLKAIVADLFPPASLFAKEICDLPSVWVKLRSFLNARGASLQQQSSRRVIMTLAKELYDDISERDAAVQMAQLIFEGGRRVRSDLQSAASISSPTTESQGNASNSEYNSGSRLVHGIAMWLTDADKKFSGDLGECWMDYVDEYSQVAKDHGLNPQQKLQYLHILFSKDAKRLHLAQVETYAQPFQQAVEMIDQE